MKDIILMVLKALVQIFMAGLSKQGCGTCSPS